MKQAVLRKTLSGSWTEFRFPDKGRKFYVKNFTEDDIYVSFSEDHMVSTAFKIKSNMGDELQMSYLEKPYPFGMVYAIYVKGTGEVEVQSEETLVPDDWAPEEN